MKAIQIYTCVALCIFTAISTASSKYSSLRADELELLFKNSDPVPALGTLDVLNVGWPSEPFFIGQSAKDKTIIFQGSTMPFDQPSDAPYRDYSLVKRFPDGRYEVILKDRTPTTLIENNLSEITAALGGLRVCNRLGESQVMSNFGQILYGVRFSGQGITPSVCGRSWPFVPNVYGNESALVHRSSDGTESLILRSGDPHPDDPSRLVGFIDLNDNSDYFHSVYAQSNPQTRLITNSTDGSALVRVFFADNNTSNLSMLKGNEARLYPLARIGQSFSSLPGFQVSAISAETSTFIDSLQISDNGRYVVQRVGLRGPGDAEQTGLSLWSALSPTQLRLVHVNGHRFNQSLNRWERIDNQWHPSPDRFRVSNSGHIYFTQSYGGPRSLHRVVVSRGQPILSQIIASGQAYDNEARASIMDVRDLTMDSSGRLYFSVLAGIPVPDGTGNMTRVFVGVRSIGSNGVVSDLLDPLEQSLPGDFSEFEASLYRPLDLIPNSTGAAVACGNVTSNGAVQSYSCYLMAEGQIYLIAHRDRPNSSHANRLLDLKPQAIIGMNHENSVVLVANTKRTDNTDHKTEILMFGTDRVLRNVSLAARRMSSGEIVKPVVAPAGLDYTLLGSPIDLKRAGISATPKLVLQAEVYPSTADINNLDGRSFRRGVVQLTLSDAEPLACPADFNASGSKTVQDFFDFLAAYSTQQIEADMNGDGVVSVQDLFDFIRAYQTIDC